MSDGGDGVLDVFGGATRHTAVTGPDGRTVDAAWRLDGYEAVIESALASGLVLVGGTNDAVRATSRGTGELLEAAVRAGATRVVVGLGGSATSDGGLGALDALSAPTLDALRRHEVRLDVCCDVDMRYVDAARVFGPQKGATPEQVELLTRRLAEAQRVCSNATGSTSRNWSAPARPADSGERWPRSADASCAASMSWPSTSGSTPRSRSLTPC